MNKESLHKSRIFIFFIISVIFIQSMIPIGVNAALTKTSDKIESVGNAKTYNMGNDLSFNGVFSSHNWYFNIDKWWSVNDVKANLKFSINQLIDPTKEAYIVLSVNNINFYSKKIYYDSQNEIQEINENIPKDLLLDGSNEIKVETYSRISDLPCIDDVNIANWVTIKGNSNVKVNFNDIIANNNLNNFPYPFLKENDDKVSSTDIVIPNDYSDSELNAALLLHSYLGKLYKNGDYNGEILKYEDFTKSPSKNVIYIGNYKNVPSELNSNIKDDKDAFLKVINSPYSKDESKKALLILSDDEKLLLKAVKTLMNDEILLQLDNDTFRVDNNLKEETKIKDENGKITFKDMGSNEVYLKGQFRKTANLSYSLPKNRVLSAGDKIKLFMRYSENLDFDKSLVTVYINNTPIGSKKLEKSNVNGDEVELPIPDDVKLSNYMELTIAFDLEMKDSYCEKREEETPWALVTGDSYVYTGLNEVNNYYFSTYGTPFTKDKKYNDVLLILPDNLDSKDLTYMGKVFSYLGKDVEYNNGNLKTIRSSKVNGEEKDSNIIIYGTPNNNDLIKKLNDNFWFKYDDTYSKFLSNEKLFLTDEFSSKIATFQLDISPYNAQKAMLLITSLDEDILRNSLEYLSSSEKIYKLNGDSAVIDQYGNIKTYKMKEEVSKPIYEKLASLDSKVKGLLGIIVLFLIFIIVVIFMYYLKNKSIEKGKLEFISRLKKFGRKHSKDFEKDDDENLKDK